MADIQEIVLQQTELYYLWNGLARSSFFRDLRGSLAMPFNNFNSHKSR